MPTVLMGMKTHEHDSYVRGLRNVGYQVVARYTPKTLLQAFTITNPKGKKEPFYYYHAVVLEAGFLFSDSRDASAIITEIRSKFPQSGVFRPRILVFFTYYDHKQGQAALKNSSINVLVCHPVSLHDLLFQLQYMLGRFSSS